MQEINEWIRWFGWMSWDGSGRMDQWLGLGSIGFFHLLVFFLGFIGVIITCLRTFLLTSNRDIQVGSCEQ